MKPRILVVDDESEARERAQRILADDCLVATARSGAEALELLREGTFSAVLLDLNLGDGPDGYAVLEQLPPLGVTTPVIVFSVRDHPQDVVKAIRLGALDFCAKTSTATEIRLVVERALRTAELHRENQVLRTALRGRGQLVVGRSEAMARVLTEVDACARYTKPVLLLGERGTGKGVLAREIHARSPRRRGVFVKVACPAIPADLMESQLFGHERGAFTHAVSRRIGSFEEAAGGTLFLDEVFEMPPHLQSKLLGVIEDQALRRIGGTTDIPTDARLVLASNRDPQEEIAARRLREDFYDRIAVFVIRIPPLRHRKEDIPLLVQSLLEEESSAMSRRVTRVTPVAMDRLIAYDWPGNVRELRQAIIGAIARARGETLDADDFAGPVAMTQSMRYWEARQEMFRRFKREFLGRALRQSDGNVTGAAELAGLQRPVFQRMMRECGMREPSDRPGEDTAQP